MGKLKGVLRPRRRNVPTLDELKNPCRDPRLEHSVLRGRHFTDMRRPASGICHAGGGKWLTAAAARSRIARVPITFGPSIRSQVRRYPARDARGMSTVERIRLAAILDLSRGQVRAMALDIHLISRVRVKSVVTTGLLTLFLLTIYLIKVRSARQMIRHVR
jgi:hypothetical protein